MKKCIPRRLLNIAVCITELFVCQERILGLFLSVDNLPDKIQNRQQQQTVLQLFKNFLRCLNSNF